MKRTFFFSLIKMVLFLSVGMWTVFGTLALFAGITGFGAAMLIAGISSKLPETEFEQEVLYGSSDAEHVFVSLPVHGLIVGDSSDMNDPIGLLSESVTYGYDIKKTLVGLADKEEVKGIILEINSPGGTIYGSHAIAEGVAAYKQLTGRPVYAFVSGMAASGGYWSAASADKIFADVGTNVGSIGVISGPFQYFDGVISESGGAFMGGVVTEKGIEKRYITAGTSKDLGNPYRKMSEKEIDALQEMVNNEYEFFVAYIAKQRNITADTITKKIGALVYDTKNASALGLIDGVLSREAVYESIAKASQLDSDTFKVIREEPSKGFLQMLVSAVSFQSPRSVGVCSFAKTNLVYFGDPSLLCK